jgi:dihydroorotate dehydrogenase
MAMENGFQGIIASNTSRRRNFPELAGVSTSLLEEAGGVSGPPLQREQREIIPEIRKLIGPKAILISAGGLADGVDARERMALGANFVQVYTRFIYAGPSFPRKLLRDF